MSPSISVGTQEATANPREFAIYRTNVHNGQLSVEKLDSLAKSYGSGSDVPADATTSFPAFAKAVGKKCSHCSADGSGDTLAFAARDESGVLSAMRLQRRPVGVKDVRLQVLYCGICHSDLHSIRSEWAPANYPLVPGHEIVGVVTEVGSAVSGFKVGDRAAVGCIVDSCGECRQCKAGEENYCSRGGPTWSYNSVARDAGENGAITQGGYSTQMVVTEKFVLRFPDSLDMAGGAPLLCAGVTTYSPLRHFGLDKPGMRLGVLGLGGLGHMAVKFGKAFGLHVTVISTSPNKREEALASLGADAFLVSRDKGAMKAAASTLDAIIDTVAAPHALQPYLSLLDTDGKIIMVGLPTEPFTVGSGELARARKTITGSMIGGIPETQEMLDFCAKHNILCDIELVPIDYANEAMERLVKNDVKYRFVLDIGATLVA